MSEQRDGEDMTTDAHGLPVRFVNQAEAEKAGDYESVRDTLLGMAEEAREVGRTAKDESVKLKALEIARKILKDAQGANSMASRHRDRATGHVDAA